MEDNDKQTVLEVRKIIEEVLIDEKEHAAEVTHVVFNSAGDYCTAVLAGDVQVNTLAAIAKAIGDDPIIGGEEYGKINLFFRVPDKNGVGRDDDSDDHQIPEYPVLAIPEMYRHKDKFPDSEDIVIPGTEVKRSATEQAQQIATWMVETGHYPIMYMRLDDGVHASVSNIYDRKVDLILAHGEAIGHDGRKYKIDKEPIEMFPIGSSICVRATCMETGRNDAYGLDFFV